MNDLTRRFYTFMFGCIPMRALIALIAYKINIDLLPYLGIITAIMGLGFLIIFFGGYRKTGAETLGAPIWWNYLRPIHGFIYLLFAYNAINKFPDSYKIIIFDTIIGFIAGLFYHIKYGYFAHKST